MKYRHAERVYVPAFIEGAKKSPGDKLTLYNVSIDGTFLKDEYSNPQFLLEERVIMGLSKNTPKKEDEIKRGDLVMTSKNGDKEWELAYYLAYVGKHKLEHVVETLKRDDWFGVDCVGKISLDEGMTFEMNGKKYRAIIVDD